MNCDEVRPLIDAYVDGELDLMNSLAVERHLPGCPDCTPIYKNRKALREALRNSPLYFNAPPRLESRLRKSIREANASSPASSMASSPASPSKWYPRRWMAAAALVTGLLLTLGIVRGLLPPADDSLVRELLTSHLRSLMVDHLSDVVSSDQHTVKPWFNGKVDFSPVVIDTTPQGFPLVGGRLDYIDNRPVAALVYQRQKHVINLFIWPADPGSPNSMQVLNRQGYNLVRWVEGGMTYWAVSDLNPPELEEFIRLIQNQGPGTTTP